MTDAQTVRRTPDPPRRAAVFNINSPFGAAMMAYVHELPMCVKQYVAWDDHVIVISEDVGEPHKGWHRADRAAADALLALVTDIPMHLYEIRVHLDEAERKAFAKAITILLTGEEA